MKRRLRRLAAFLVLLYAAASCVGCAVVNAAMFHPPRPPYGTDLPGLETIGPADAPVAVVWSPVPGAKKAVLFAHGNAEDLRFVRGRVERFNRLGWSVLAYDYPGYGRTPGEPTEKSVYAAAETAFRNLVEERGFAEGDVVVCGYSIGSGPACYLAERHDVGGLLLFAPFKSAIRVVTGVRILPIDPFPNLARVPRTRCPVLVFHGTADRVIPFSHGRAVAAAAGERGRFVPVPGASHEAVCTALPFDEFRREFESLFATSSHFLREIRRNPAAKTLALADKAAVETILAESGQPFGDGWDLPEETKRKLEDVLGPPQKILGFGIARGLWVFPDKDEFEIEYGGIPHAAWNRERVRRERALSSMPESFSEPFGNAIWGPSVP